MYTTTSRDLSSGAFRVERPRITLLYSTAIGKIGTINCVSNLTCCTWVLQVQVKADGTEFSDDYRGSSLRYQDMKTLSIQRKIGDATVPALGFGAMGLSICYGPVGTEADRLKVLDAAYEKGSTFWDTADAYGDNEDLIGKWFKANPEKRSSIFLATKFGFTMTGAQGDPEYIKQQFNKSLQRLGVDYIDLYYQHRVDPKVPIEVTIGAMAELVKQGKVKYLGISECSAADLRRAHAVHPISALQIEYSPFILDLEKPPFNLLSTARELGVTVVAYSPLGRGLLTGQIKSLNNLEADDFRRTLPKLGEENFPKILGLVEKIGEVGKRHGATPGQTALAWVLAQGENITVIPGTKRINYLEENVGADNVKLSKEEVAEIRKAAEATDIPGSRYGPGMMEMVCVESPPLEKA